MGMELNAILENLTDAGCNQNEADMAKRLYDAGQTDELTRFFKKCRSV